MQLIKYTLNIMKNRILVYIEKRWLFYIKDIKNTRKAIKQFIDQRNMNKYIENSLFKLLNFIKNSVLYLWTHVRQTYNFWVKSWARKNNLMENINHPVFCSNMIIQEEIETFPLFKAYSRIKLFHCKNVIRNKIKIRLVNFQIT